MTELKQYGSTEPRRPAPAPAPAGTASPEAEAEQERQKWGSPVEFLLSCIAMSVSTHTSNPMYVALNLCPRNG